MRRLRPYVPVVQLVAVGASLVQGAWVSAVIALALIPLTWAFIGWEATRLEAGKRR